MIVRAVRSIAAAAALTLVLPQAARAQAATAQPAAPPPRADRRAGARTGCATGAGGPADQGVSAGRAEDARRRAA